MAGVLADNMEKLLGEQGGEVVVGRFDVSRDVFGGVVSCICAVLFDGAGKPTVSLFGGGIIAGFGHKHSFWSGFAEFVSQEWAPSFAISMSLAMLSFGVSQVAQAIKNAKTHSIFRDIKLDFNSGNSLELHFCKAWKIHGV